MSGNVTGLSSMATRGVLSELAAAFGGDTVMEATSGVDAARRIRLGEVIDVVVLADGVMRRLASEGHILPGSLRAIALSAIAIAVREGDQRPCLAEADDVRGAVLAARRTGYSTGPSGDHLLRLLDEWGIRAMLGNRLIQAPPGVPVGRLLAEGAVDLAFQQRSELMGIDGVTIAGTLPAPIRMDTVFTAGMALTAARPQAAQAFISFLVSPTAADAKRRHGMEPVLHRE